MRIPSKSISIKNTLKYAGRLLYTILLMEIMMHFVYVVAIAKFGSFDKYTPFELSLVGYFNLKYVYLKVRCNIKLEKIKS